MSVTYRVLDANWITSDQMDGLIPLPTEQELVQTGIYKHIRNPVYLGNYFIVGGFTFLTLDVIIFVLIVIQSVGFNYYTLDEEKALLKHFGSDYTQYFQRTGRFFPNYKDMN